MRRNFFKFLLGFLLVRWAWCLRTPREISIDERRELRDEVVGAFRHAFDAYMTHACELDSYWFSCAQRPTICDSLWCSRNLHCKLHHALSIIDLLPIVLVGKWMWVCTITTHDDVFEYYCMADYFVCEMMHSTSWKAVRGATWHVACGLPLRVGLMCSWCRAQTPPTSLCLSHVRVGVGIIAQEET